MLRPRSVLALLALTLAPVVALAAPVADREGRLTLREGWQLQTSAKVRAPGSSCRRLRSSPATGTRSRVPTTVVAALVKNKVLRDPYFGMNMRELPGGNYKIASNFSNADMPADSPFRGALVVPQLVHRARQLSSAPGARSG